MKSPLNPYKLTLDGIVYQIFPQSSIIKACIDLKALNIFGDLSQRIQSIYDFKTQVHVELLLVNKFQSGGYDFYADNSYISYSKLACFCYYYYINSLPERFIIS
jgi:hypothetical protein